MRKSDDAHQGEAHSMIYGKGCSDMQHHFVFETHAMHLRLGLL